MAKAASVVKAKCSVWFLRQAVERILNPRCSSREAESWESWAVPGSAIKALRDLERVRHLVLANPSLSRGGGRLAQHPDSLWLLGGAGAALQLGSAWPGCQTLAALIPR